MGKEAEVQEIERPKYERRERRKEGETQKGKEMQKEKEINSPDKRGVSSIPCTTRTKKGINK